MQLRVESHPSLDVAAFVTRFSPNLGAFSGTALRVERPPGLSAPDDALRSAIRDVLRHTGYKPTGRAKPSSEYLLRAEADGALRPINLAVDIANLVSLHSGLPISVVDASLLREPLRIAAAPAGAQYVFNPAGQTIDLSGLLCLHDAQGPCANAVKDAQRTKTSEQTELTLSILWSSRQLQARTDLALEYYRQLLRAAGLNELEKVTLRAVDR
jgi:DNA/RNA-binding domain of Phe-tRNA-synthetase-like protein